MGHISLALRYGFPRFRTKLVAADESTSQSSKLSLLHAVAIERFVTLLTTSVESRMHPVTSCSAPAAMWR